MRTTGGGFSRKDSISIKSDGLEVIAQRILIGVFCGMVSMAATMDCRAAANENPYQAIMDRNPFRLKPKPPATVSPIPSPPPIEVCLTGMYRLRGKKGVVLRIVDKSTGPNGDLPPPLREGDVHGRVEIVSIQVEKSAVIVRIDGKEQTLTFEKNPPKSAAAAPLPPRSAPTAAVTQRFSARPPSLPQAYESP